MDHPILAHVALGETFCFSEGKSRPDKRSDVDKFLSSLALLLNGSETATAIYIHRARRQVVIARNQPISARDESFFNQFFRLVRVYASVAFDESLASAKKDVYDALESLVLDYNSKKIIKRLTGKKHFTIAQLRHVTDLDVSGRHACFDQVRLRGSAFRTQPLMTDKWYFANGKGDREEYLEWIVDRLRQFFAVRDELLLHSTQPSTEKLSLIASIAVTLYQSQLFHDVLKQQLSVSDDAVQYFEKMSAHRRALSYILQCLSIHRDRYRDLYKTVTWKVILPTCRMTTLTSTPRQALEEIVAHLIETHDDDDVRDLLKTVPVDDYYPGNSTALQRFETGAGHEVHLHAEIALIDYLLANRIDETSSSRDVEIGISKMPCLACSYYIHELNVKYNRRFCSADWTHGKIYSKWDYREGEDPVVLDAVDQKLLDRIKAVILRTCAQKIRSTTKKSGDSDIMFTSLEGEEFENEDWKWRMQKMTEAKPGGLD